MDPLAADLLRVRENRTLVEADAIIQSWIAELKTTSPPLSGYHVGGRVHSGYRDLPSCWSQTEYLTQASNRGPVVDDEILPRGGDYVATMDWEDGGVRENVQKVMVGLLDAPVKLSERRMITEKERDPSITMEMRHKEVKKRRRIREEERRIALEAERSAREARARAELLVKKEEKERRRRELREEATIRQHMSSIRRHMNEQQERKRLLIKQEEKKEKVKCAMRIADIKETRIIDIARIRTTRACLAQQLLEAGEVEAKHRLMLLQQCFTMWWRVMEEGRAKERRAQVVASWRLLLRCWRAWRRQVWLEKSKRAEKLAALQLRMEQQKMATATLHYQKRLLRHCLHAWTREVHSQRLHGGKEDKERKRVYKQKLACFLSAVEKRDTHEEEEEKMVEMDKESEASLVAQDQQTKCHSSVGHPMQARLESNIWSTARNHVDNLLARNSTSSPTTVCCVKTAPSSASVDAVSSALPFPQNNTSAIVSSYSNTAVTSKPPAKPVTKTAAFKGMAERTTLLAERRLAREERRKKMEEQEHARKAEEEEQQLLREKELREAVVAKKREEKRLVREREADRQQRTIKMAAHIKMADEHRQRRLLLVAGFRPWVLFVRLMRSERIRAVQWYEVTLLRGVFVPWRRTVRKIEEERMKKADQCCKERRLRHVMMGWNQYMQQQKQLQRTADRMRPVILTRCVFTSWYRVVRETRIEMWEKEHQARRCHERLLKRRVLKKWCAYVPLSREERLREQRRAKLRRKVAQWLPDYQPTNNDPSQ